MTAPNVLFITADQWRAECLSSLDHAVVRTPHLDRLAARGVTFREHWAQAAPCGPSRASIYTGMYLMNHRSVLNGTPLDARHTNIALEARVAGYEPTLFGYTDTSVDPRTVAAGDPALREYEGVLPGFDGRGHLPEGNPRAWLEWLRDQGQPVDPDGDWRSFVDTPAPGYPGVERFGEHRGPTQYPAELSQTAYLTDRVIEHVATSDRPWFVHLSYLRPHPPFFAPEPYNTMYAPESVPAPTRAATPSAEGEQHPLVALLVQHPFLAAPAGPDHLRQLRATYYGMQTEVDHHIGRLVDHLQQSGELDNTLIVFTSDHGEQLGDHYLMHKLGYFDESFHVPLIVVDPSVDSDATRGHVVDAFSENVDVTPTILDLLGAPVPLQCDGRSLRPFLNGEDAPDDWRTEVHFEFDFRDPDGGFFESAFGLTLEECSLAVVRDHRGKYVHFGGRHVFPPIFFDLTEDPDQLVNRAPDPACADRVLEYAERMLSWRMRHAERTLTGMKLTQHAGLVEARAARVR